MQITEVIDKSIEDREMYINIQLSEDSNDTADIKFLFE